MRTPLPGVRGYTDTSDMWYPVLFLCFTVPLGMSCQGHAVWVRLDTGYTSAVVCSLAANQHTVRLMARPGWAPLVRGALCQFSAAPQTPQSSGSPGSPKHGRLLGPQNRLP